MKKIFAYLQVVLYCLSACMIACHCTEWNCKNSTNTGTFNRSMDCTISGNNHIVVTNTLEIIGSNTDMNHLITITAATGKRHFYINGANNKLILRYIKLTGGDVTGNSYNSTCCNPSTNYGGAIWIIGGELHLYASILFNNTANSGGAIRTEGPDNEIVINIYNSSIIHNVATYSSGGIAARLTNVNIFNSNISHNIAKIDIGGIYIDVSDVVVYNTTISFNKAGKGGGIYIKGYDTPGSTPKVNLTKCVILKMSCFEIIIL